MSKLTNLTLFAACAALAACGNDGSQETAHAGAVNAKAEQKASNGETLNAGLSKSHGKLAEAFKIAGLEGVLAGSAPYTVFAPTDEALGKVPGGLPQDKAALGNILTGHMVPGTVTMADLRRAIDRNGKAELATLGGGMLTLTRSDDTILVKGPAGEARVAGSESTYANGAVHGLDGVLNPS